MTFPTVGTILDNFNRANENPATGWTGLLNNIQIISNQAASNLVGNVVTYFSASTYGADTEAYFTISTKPPVTGSVAVLARIVDTGSVATIDGYLVDNPNSSGTDTINIQRIDNAVATVLGSAISQETSNGDSIGIEIIGSTISAYYKPSAGSWTLLGSRTDSTYSGAGRIGISSVSDTSNRIDNFGGGTVIPPQAINKAGASSAGLQITASPGNVNSAINKSSASGVGLATQANYIQDMNNAISSGVGLQPSSLLTQNANIDNADSSGIGNDLTTNYIQDMDNASASGIGNDVDFSVGAISISVDTTDSSADGYDVITSYIQSINKSNASSSGYQVNFSVSGISISVNNAVSEAIGNELNSIYIQSLGLAISEAVGYQVNRTTGNVNKSIDLASSSAIGYETNTITGTPVEIDKADSEAIGYELNSLVGNVNVNPGKANSTGLSYEPQTHIHVSVDSSTSSAIGNDVDNTFLQTVNKAISNAIGYDINALLGNTNINVNRANSSATGNNVNFTTGSIMITVNYAISSAIGKEVSIGLFQIILSPDRTYKVLVDNRIYIVNSENRIIKAQEN